MTNATLKKIIKALSEAPKAAAAQLLRELPPAERDEARRIFAALGIAESPKK